MSTISQLNLNYSGTTELQDKYFSSEENCGDLITGLSSAVHSKDPNAVMAKSCDGVTGFTFLCTVPTNHIEGENEIDTVPAVLKWQDDTLCKVEQFGARVFRRLGFQAPLSYLLDAQDKRAIALMKFASKTTPAMGALVGKISCLVMPRLHCNNLSHIAKEEEFFLLNENDQKRMLQEFGRVAAVDLLMGNDDRFIRFPTAKEPDFPPSIGKINPGNILVHLNQSEFNSIFPIDSCPSQRLLKKERQPSGDSIGGLFDSMESSDPDEDILVHSNPMEFADQEKESIQKLDLESEIELFHQIFVDFYEAPEKYAAQFTSSFMKVLGCQETHLEEFKTLVEQAFLEGILDQTSLLAEAAEIFCEEVNTWDQSNEGVFSAKTLLIKNLEYLKNSN